MQIIKEVKIKIESVIDNLDPSGLVEGESERNITEHTGSYSFSEERTTLTYSETGEGGKVDSEIIYENGSVRVKRFGAIESDLLFKEGEHSLSLYSVPPYKFDADVFARRIRVDLSEMSGKIELFYNMKIGGAEKSARMKIWISPSSNQT